MPTIARGLIRESMQVMIAKPLAALPVKWELSKFSLYATFADNTSLKVSLGNGWFGIVLFSASTGVSWEDTLMLINVRN
jgi:hypothetical protein